MRHVERVVEKLNKNYANSCLFQHFYAVAPNEIRLILKSSVSVRLLTRYSPDLEKELLKIEECCKDGEIKLTIDEIL